MSVADTLRNLYPNVTAGDIGAVLTSFDRKATVDSPLGGKQTPTQWIASEGSWLRAHDARIDDADTVSTPERIAHELILSVTIDGAEREIPVLLVADVADEAIRDLRIYHSTWPINGSHMVRSPVLNCDRSLVPAEPVAAYEKALAEGDASAIDGLFEPDGYVREPAGADYAHAGKDRSQWYATILGGGPLPLKLCTITDDGARVVIEYTGDEWGRRPIPPQAGGAVYERSDRGKLAAARIYDDFDPPKELFE
jgi:hypothetical protein